MATNFNDLLKENKGFARGFGALLMAIPIIAMITGPVQSQFFGFILAVMFIAGAVFFSCGFGKDHRADNEGH